MTNLISIEYLRAFSILYIVGYWHLFNYTDALPKYANPVTGSLAVIVLGVFVLVSGFLNGSSAKKGVGPIQFYRKRLLRIYPMYALAVLLFYLYGISDATTSLKSLVFISIFYGPSPYTLWFVTMIMLFYLITPLLLGLVGSPAKFLLFSGSLFVIVFGIEAVSSTMDRKLLLYLPCYCVGIYCSRHGFKGRVANIPSVLLVFCLWLVLAFIENDSWTFNQIRNISMVFSCSFLISAICYLNEDRFGKAAVISFLSYSGYSMYLFHRPIYSTLVSLYFPGNELLQVVYLSTVCLLVIIFTSWGIQKIYDKGCFAISKVD
ncbi:MAG: hypothetical protein DRP71_00660 [Verrucomicrobia bacterium]|nr:MAG: hypothetical protein DRP71_00660 [Verrucomicrobiota bacterium]